MMASCAFDPRYLLDNYPVVRSRSPSEACEMVGRVFSKHRLDVRGSTRGFATRHNRIAMQHTALNVLSYGSEVVIDPGERGDFYLMQLPLSGRARLRCAGQEVNIDTGSLAILHPHMQTRMLWSEDCTMLLLQVPRTALDMGDSARGQASPRFALAQSRSRPAIGAWCQVAVDLAHNLDRFGAHWLKHPLAYAAMEGFLLHGLATLLQPEDELALDAAQRAAPLHAANINRCVQRARDYMHCHVHEPLFLQDVARAACVSPRTLEAAFKRVYQQSPLAYLRGLRLDRVHQALGVMAGKGLAVSVTELALQHGFVHMGRFSAYYKERFGCSPSHTLRAA